MANGSLDDNVIVNKLCVNAIIVSSISFRAKKRSSCELLFVIRLE